MRPNFYLGSLLIAVALVNDGPAAVAAGIPSMAKDMTTLPAGSDVVSITKVGSTAFFKADDGVHGFELWKTDGTLEGTELVKDIIPGGRSGLSSGNDMIAVENTLFFWTNDGVHGNELWKSDGTEVGTDLVKDITPGGDGSYPYLRTDRMTMCSSGGLLFFGLRDDAGNAHRLWKSDGTEVGTVLVKGINPSGDPRPDEMCDFNGTLFFSANDGIHGHELWQSDGTPDGTVMLKDINLSGDSSPAWMTLFDGKLFFSADNGLIGTELWTTDGTEGNTVLFQDINRTGSSSGFPAQLKAIDGKLYFSAWNVNFTEPWVSDGTPGAGHTFMLKNIHSYHSNPKNFTGCNGVVYFQASSSSGFGLWKTDGTAVGTRQVKAPVVPDPITAAGDTLFFIYNGLWMSDGTTGGTVEVSEAFPGTLLGDDEMVELNGALLLTGSDGDSGAELWLFDPAVGAGGLLVKDIHTGTKSSNFASNNDHNFLEIDGVAFFTAAAVDEIHPNPPWGAGMELWRTDGTEDGTYLVRDIRPGEEWSEPQRFVNVNGILFFTADDGVHERELWRSDGTAEGTLLVKDIYQGNWQGVDDQPDDLVEYRGELFFTADDNEHGRELWKSDGTYDGTVMVSDIRLGSSTSYIRHLVVYQDRLFFAANEGTTGTELWTSDGTPGGTMLFKDITEFVQGSKPSSLTVVGDSLYFTAQREFNDTELWKSDGTPEGTVMVKDINPSDDAIHSERFGFVNDLLFFVADDEIHGEELWATDGTEAGTYMVKDIYLGSDGSIHELYDFAVANGFLFFEAQDGPIEPDLVSPGSTGRELWKSDGTEEGTRLVKDIIPNAGDLVWHGLKHLTEANGTVFFVVDDGVHGEEVWATDGTEEGTQILIDLFPGNTGRFGLQDPVILGTLGGRSGGFETLLFGGDDYRHGYELWKVTAPSGFSLLGPIRALDGKFSFTFEATMGNAYRIDRSTDLDDWTTLETFDDRAGNVLFEDADAVGANRFFYRVLETETP